VTEQPTSQHEHLDVGHWPWRQVGRCVYCGCGWRIGSLARVPSDMGKALELLQALDAMTAEVHRRMGEGA
jgi:hypothetical protein